MYTRNFISSNPSCAKKPSLYSKYHTESAPHASEPTFILEISYTNHQNRAYALDYTRFFIFRSLHQAHTLYSTRFFIFSSLHQTHPLHPTRFFIFSSLHQTHPLHPTRFFIFSSPPNLPACPYPPSIPTPVMKTQHLVHTIGYCLMYADNAAFAAQMLRRCVA
jgi:hypothetical protein